MATPSARTRQPLVVQHNALINGRFDLNTTETRLFLAMLAQIQRDDTSFARYLLCEMRTPRAGALGPCRQPELWPHPQSRGKLC
ncbi:replication initiation protein [Hymenobacter crusticola]|uniref:Initiator Rep protein WH1 domain-containing protein n=1 Tax=Hymenobacter crusticola TaxID=1770526 RepID=A0A243W4M7_9BACT|nr:hypothetical protein BXP70_29235 [Hymenobacter crusticola]